MSRTNLSQRTICAYNRFSQEIAAINYIRKEKPSGPLGPATVAACNRLIRAANRLFGPEPDMPRFELIDTTAPMTQADLLLLTARLSVAAFNFEDRYAHQSEAGLASVPASSEFPSPHRH